MYIVWQIPHCQALISLGQAYHYSAQTRIQPAMTALLGMDWFMYHLRTDQYALYTDMPQFTRHCFPAPLTKTLINFPTLLLCIKLTG